MLDPPPQLNLNLEPTPINLPLSLPATPTTPNLPSDSKPKKTNPLNDLIDTEKAYIDLLGGVIKKVAAAWSRSNLPPPQLDSMFRSIESVYRSNRSLHSKLKEIGTSSPKALGDLLIRWVDDLEGPYANYCEKFCTGFDEWEPVQSNIRLGPILATFSAANPPPLVTHPDTSLWTLDALFLLPKARLKYYKKLYSRLLKSTQPGRSDHRLLVEAVEKLEKLLATLDERENVKAGSPATSPTSVPPVLEPEDEVVIDMTTRSPVPNPSSVRASDPDAAPSSQGSSVRGSGTSEFERLSQGTPSTVTSRGSSSTLSMPVSDLERRLSTQRTLDIFTMSPKMVRLQMSPPSLSFTRELRCSLDIDIRLTPRSTGVEVVHKLGHLFLLSDLFLVCERMTAEERAEHGTNGADMWLCYPPLAGKVLRVSELPGQDTSFQVHIMRKETIILTTDSVESRNHLFAEFKDCIEFASSVGPQSKQAPPPVPALPGTVKPNSFPLPAAPDVSMSPASERDSGVPSIPSTRTSSPPNMNDSNRQSSNSPGTPERGPSPRSSSGMDSITGQFANMAMSPDSARRMSPPVAGPGTAFPPLAGGSVGPGQVFSPARSTSIGHGPGSPAGQPPRQHPIHPYQPPHPQMPPQPHMYPGGQQQMFAPQPMHRPYGPPGEAPIPPRPPSEPYQNNIRKSPSTRSLNAQHEMHARSAPPMPNMPAGGFPPNAGPPNHFLPRVASNGTLHSPHSPAQLRPVLPSSQFKRAMSTTQSFVDPSPPNSPVEETPRFPSGPVTSIVSATMKCKVFLKQQHAQWKSLGSAKLKLYRQDPTNIKQLVVEAENKDHSVLISTIVLTDGVERVGKTGVAIELSDQGARTGIVYMLQLRNEQSAGGLFDSLLEGSDRSGLK
ncbi:gef1 [Moniliophthora roreri MCA 2997]|uniref:Gef1 n=2 Tax=Moniliophthora roreri TaxID=221103 RepID=V2X928_MONRO|nr:gef1 [Moniliophthora roreri MCA 2997]KAI3621875.1 gef1 [Moniliophthora roreri]